MNTVFSWGINHSVWLYLKLGNQAFHFWNGLGFCFLGGFLVVMPKDI